MPRGVPEPDERQAGYDTGADKKKREWPIRWVEDGCASALQNDQIDEGEGTEERGLQKETGNGACPRFLAQEVVDPKEDAQRATATQGNFPVTVKEV